MVNALNPEILPPQKSANAVPVFAQKALDRCHIIFPDCEQPTSAIFYEQQYYAYVKFFASSEKAQEVAQRLIGKGKRVILTRVRTGIVLWIHEPEAHLAK
ncbi:MAG: hypothetical protein AAGA75_09430 [Cyanobacteria bacterium P01_E01_bin.6]